MSIRRSIHRGPLEYKTMTLLLIKAAILIGLLQACVAYVVWVERKVIARMQNRLGPNRVGFGILATLPIVGGLFSFTKGTMAYGLGQPIADALKLFMKENIEPDGIDKWPYRIAPILSILTVFTGWAVVPIGPDFVIFGHSIRPQVSELPVALVYLLAIGSLGAYSTILAGWASNSKYSLLGSLRAAAQLVSYELPLGISLLTVVMISGTLNLRETVMYQSQNIWFAFSQPIAFIIAVIAMTAEANRSPFDMAEAESELVAGFHTEYSGMKFALFFLAEYAHMFLSASILTCLFMGGWKVPFLPLEETPWALAVFVYAAKVMLYMLLCIWLRASFPRLRYDQVMKFCWKVLTPIAVVNLIATAIIGKL